MKKRIFSIAFIFALLFFVTSCGDNEPFEPQRSNWPVTLQAGDLSFHFLELGNKFTGDCVYINYDNMDIIIDAGSKQTSATTIIAYIDQFIRDDIVEFVIATHPHEDHIAAFYSDFGVTGIFDAYEIGTIIDFTETNRNTATYRKYIEARNNLVASGKTKHYSALQCYYEEVEGALRIYDLDPDGKVQLEILYNYYTEFPVTNENNNSVCIRIIQGENQYLFTADLETVAENRLVEYYENKYPGKGLGHHVLYKGGHHGSNTSSGVNLMAAITPDYICVCSCAGNYEYDFNSEAARFPGQQFIDRVAPYTDAVYVTTIVEDKAAWDDNRFTSFNGNIIFLVRNNEFSVHCSNNDLKLKETEWFKKNKTMPPAWM